MNLAEIATALGDQIRANVTRPTNVYVFDPKSTRQYPCIIIEPGEPFVEYQTTFGTDPLLDVNFTITVAVSARTLDEQIAIYDYLSDGDEATSSIRKAAAGGRNTTTGGLGGLVEDFVVDRVHKPEIDEYGALAARFDVRVMARRGSTS